MSFIDLEFARASSEYNGKIIYVEFKNDPTIDMEAAKLLEKAVIELSQNLPIIMFVNTSNVRGEFENDAKKYLSNSNRLKKIRKGQVFIVDTLANRIIVTFYSRLFKRSIPSKVLNNYKQAKIVAEKMADEHINR